MVTSGGVPQDYSQRTSVRAAQLRSRRPRAPLCRPAERFDRHHAVLARPDPRHHAVDQQDRREPAARGGRSARVRRRPLVARRGDDVLVERGQQPHDARAARRPPSPRRPLQRQPELRLDHVAERLEPLARPARATGAEPLRQLLAGGRAVAGEEAARDLLRRVFGSIALERLGQREAPCPPRRSSSPRNATRLEQVAVAAREARVNASASSSRVFGPSRSAAGTPSMIA